MVLLREEVDISGGDDAHELAAHFARLRDRNAREAVSYFGLSHIADRVARTHHNWVCDKALLKPLESERNRTNHDYHKSFYQLNFPSLCLQSSKSSVKPNDNCMLIRKHNHKTVRNENTHTKNK